MAKIYNDITETIGNTPLVRLNRTAALHGAQAEVLGGGHGGPGAHEGIEDEVARNGSLINQPLHKRKRLRARVSAVFSAVSNGIS